MTEYLHQLGTCSRGERIARIKGLSDFPAAVPGSDMKPYVDFSPVRPGLLRILPRKPADGAETNRNFLQWLMEDRAGSGGISRESQTELRLTAVPEVKIWTQEEFLQNVDMLGAPGVRARKVAENLIALGRAISDGSDPYYAPSKYGSAIFNLNEVGLFTVYPEGLYIRVLRNTGKHGAPTTEGEWDEVITRLNTSAIGTFARRELGHARMVNRPLAALTDDELARFGEFVQWFAEGVRARQASSSPIHG